MTVSSTMRKTKRQNLLQIVLNTTVMPFRWLRSAFRCFYCYDIFKTPRELKTHTETHGEDDKINTVAKFLDQNVYVDVSSLRCTICFAFPATLDELIGHLVEKHEIEIDSEFGSCMRPFKLNDSDCACCECDNTFELFGTLLLHAKDKSSHDDCKSFLCSSCGANFATRQNLKNHTKTVHDKIPIKCTKCGALVRKSQMATHVQNNHNKTYNCEVCEERFPSYYRRLNHMMVDHGHRSKRKCPHCSLTFVFNSTMQKHIQEVHLQEKRVVCSECGWQAFTVSRMKRHMMKHVDERAVKCAVCDVVFKTNKVMQQHLEKVHKI